MENTYKLAQSEPEFIQSSLQENIFYEWWLSSVENIYCKWYSQGIVVFYCK